MALSEVWVQDLLTYEATLEPPNYRGSESGEISRAWIDGALIVYDIQDPPGWLIPVLKARDEDGNTPFSMPHMSYGE